MLFFELFPAFFALVSLIIGILLFLANQRASREPEQPPERPVRRAPVGDEHASAAPRSGVRPSMRS